MPKISALPTYINTDLTTADYIPFVDSTGPTTGKMTVDNFRQGLFALGSATAAPLNGLTSVTFTTFVGSVTALATPGAMAATTGYFFASTVSGATLMGFGTTGDVTLKNRAGTDVIVVTSNTTGVTMAGALAITGALSGVTTVAASGILTLTNATASTTAGTGAVVVTGGVGIGGRLNVTGQVIFAGVLSSTSYTFTLNLISTTALATPGAISATQFTGFASTVSGAAIMGYGTTNDVALMNRAGTVCLGVGPNTTAINIPGALGVTGAITGAGGALFSHATAGLGYATGAGGAATQGTNRTTAVQIDKVCGAITLFSAAGHATWQTFTLTNSTIAATDTVLVAQKSGTDINILQVSNVAAGSCKISFATTGGTTTEQPVFNFSVIKAVAA